jgi:hypothetical protein
MIGYQSGEAVSQESRGLRPISANLRSLGLYTEDLSRRDSVKVDDMSRQLTALAAKLSAL